ncbi:hypothetical protein QYE76_022509 [Lolium multiflorum]|uniref:Uncharacterized protein n=1 Tax=Lolium multiflorum TaxID=4521 RepID=A0AAD8RB29_LOLMU|nr:hypothetical protein QYE76_022509 [Lolium multiflorum]
MMMMASMKLSTTWLDLPMTDLVPTGLLERDIFDLFLPEFDKPWVIHLRKLAAVLQTSALGGPTLSTRIEAPVDIKHFPAPLPGRKDKTLLDTTCSGSFTSNKEEFKRDLLDRIKENAEDWENDKGKESGYADKPPFKPLPPKEGNEEKKKKKKGTKKKKKENKKKEVTAYPRVNEITLGNRKYVAPNDYYDNESEYDDLPIPFTHISDHDLDEHAAFDIENLFGTDYEINDDNIIHVPLNDDIESSKLGDAVLEDPIFETSTFSENDDITYLGLLERDIFDLFLPEFDKPWGNAHVTFLRAEGGFLEGAGGGMAEPLAGEDGLEGAEEVLAGEAVGASVLFSRTGGNTGSDRPVYYKPAPVLLAPVSSKSGGEKKSSSVQ